MAVIIGAFREASEQERSLEEWRSGWSGRWRGRDAARWAGCHGGFVTAVLAEIPAGSDGLRIVNRGHPEPILLHQDGSLQVLTPAVPALPLGMELGCGRTGRTSGRCPPGRRCWCSLTVCPRRGTRPGLLRSGRPAAGPDFPGPEELLSALTDDVRLHTGGRSTDDMALLAVGRPAEGQPERRTTVRIVGRG
ncbi:SpoIIE family protein phosphatase [Streptomyces sp. M10(2022)]